MPGALLHLGATVQCMHAAPAKPQPMVPNRRVRVGGQPIVTKTSTYSIIGCTQNPPCATAQWQSAATRVKAGGVSVLLQDSQARCVPTGTGLKIVATQRGVRGT
jgi:hypothetical protein